MFFICFASAIKKSNHIFRLFCCGVVFLLLSKTIAFAASATTTTLAATVEGKSATTATVGSTLLLTATVESGSSAVKLGLVDFCNAAASHCTGVNRIGTATVSSSGTARIALAPDSGAHSYKAIYRANKSDASSSSATLAVTITGSAKATVTSIAATGHGYSDADIPSTYSFASTVSSATTTAPTGDVEFQDLSTEATLDRVTLSAQKSVTASAPTMLISQSITGFTCAVAEASADINADGIRDLVVIDRCTNGINVYLGNSDGNYSLTHTYTTQGYSPRSLAIADFNGDGNPDLAIYNSVSGLKDAYPSINIYTGAGDGSFTYSSSFDLKDTNRPLALFAADFENTGHMDLAAVSLGGVSLCTGAGDGTFSVASLTYIGGTVVAAALGDFQADGYPDLAFITQSSGLFVYFGTASSSFHTTRSFAVPATFLSSATLLTGDLNSDGRDDLVLLNSASGELSTYLAGTTGIFTRKQLLATNSLPAAAILSPWSGGSSPDLISANANNGNLLFYHGLGDGSFSLASTTNFTSQPSQLVVGGALGSGQLVYAEIDAADQLEILNLATSVATANTSTTSPLTLSGAGSHQIAAVYSGDANHNTSTSASLYLSAQSPAPTISLPSGSYASAISVTLKSTNSAAAIYYTTDGRAPTSSATLYSAAIKIASTTRLRAVAIVKDFAPSPIVEADYILVSAALPNQPQWSFVGGGTAANQPGHPGSLGQPSAANIPAGRSSVLSWSPKSGELWLYGGITTNANGFSLYFNDLWHYSSGKWSWISGTPTPATNSTVYSASSGSTPNPGNRSVSLTWSDSSGNLWLYGGYGLTPSGTQGWLADLWRYNPTLGQWSFLGGSQKTNQPATRGTLGSFAAANLPGSRENSSTWTDAAGRLWLFGGSLFDASGNLSYYNDLWCFDPKSASWAWIAGASTSRQIGSYGVKGTASAASHPGARSSAMAWSDSSGNLWLFGGLGLATSTQAGMLNDLWKFSTTTKQWSWISGSNLLNSAGSPGDYGNASAANQPAGRQSAATARDASGNLWFFGGFSLLGYLSDLWCFSPSTAQWTLMSGSQDLYQFGDFGPPSTPSFGYNPGARYAASAWFEGSSFHLFGGYGQAISPNAGYLNDHWAFALLPLLPSPSITPGSSSFTGSISVTLASSASGAVLYYSSDGSQPSATSKTSARYTSPLTLTATTTLRVVATRSGAIPSPIASATFTRSK